MATSGYIGKISALVTANTSDLERKLNGSTAQVKRFGRNLNSTIVSASRSAEAALNGIFTPLQRLQRALQVGGGRLRLIDEREVARIQQLTQAAREVAAPLRSIATGFDQISDSIAGEFTPALNLAQQQAKLLETGIQTFGSVSERAFNRVRQRAEETAQSFSRVREAAAAASALATGRELRFTNPALVAENARAAAIQGRAASLSASQISDGGIGGLVAQQRQASEEAARLLARLENIRATRNGDAGEAQRALNAQVAAYRRVNEALDEQIARFTRLAEAQRRAAEQSDRFTATELNRRDGTLSRRNANTFEDATAGVFAQTARPQGAFEAARRTVETELARTRDLFQRFSQLPANVQQSLEAERNALNNLSIAARDGAASLQVLADANDRVAASIDGANAAISREQQNLADANRRLVVLGPQDLVAEEREAALVAARGRRTSLVDGLAAPVQAVRDRIEGLADPLRASLGPAVDQVLNSFRQLSRQGVQPVAADIQNLRSLILGLNQALNSRRNIGEDFRNSFGGAGAAGLGLGVDQRSLRAIGSEIEFVQTRLANLGAEARGPVLQALQQFRVTAENLFQGGALDTEEGRAELQAYRQELIRTISAATGQTQRQVAQSLRRVGDIARNAGNTTGLALQQAFFAIDDFFSVTGGLDQRIRAAGNNISQLAFIIGNTYGLAVGVAITVTAQLAAGLIRLYNEGRTAEDVTKALNSSLEKQIDLAKQLKEALRSAFDGVIDPGFSEQTRELVEFRRQLEELRRQQRERREEAVFNANPAVVAARQEVNAAQRAVDEATTPGQFVVARQRLERANLREQEARRGALAPVTNDELLSAVRRSFALERASNTPLGAVSPSGAEDIARRQRESEATLERAARQQDSVRRIGSQRAELRTRIRELGSQPADSRSQEAIAELNAVLTRLESGLALAIDNAVSASLETSFQAGREVARSQDRASQAGAVRARQAIDEANAARDGARRQVERANEIPDVDRRGRAVAAATNALAEADANARRVADSFSSLINSVEAFGSVLDRVSNELANTVAQEARGAADQARRETNASAARFGRLGDTGSERDLEFNRNRQRRLQQQAEEAERRQFELQQQNLVRRERFEEDAAAGRFGPNAQALVRQRDEAQRVIDDSSSTAAQVAEATRRRDRANFDLNRQLEQSPSARAARDRADELDREAQRNAQREADIVRGRELAETPAARAGRELADNLRGLQSFFDQQVADGALGRQDAASQLAQAQQRLVSEAFRAQAPAIAGLADSVRTAVLQGPSRAALNATDISTTEGARELNRLIRGDDAARDQNLAELQRQSQQLDQLIQAVKDNGGPVAN